MSDPFTMVIAIVAIATVGKVMNTRYKAKNGIIEDEDGNQKQIAADPTNQRMSGEIKELKERIAVLERIATDNNSANDLNRQIEELRQR
jgi:Ctf8